MKDALMKKMASLSTRGSSAKESAATAHSSAKESSAAADQGAKTAAPSALAGALSSHGAPEGRSSARPVDVPWGRGRTCFTVDGFLTTEECARLIEISEGCSYEPALVNIGMGRQMLMSDVRKSGRVIIDSPEAVEIIWRRLQHLVPSEIVPGVSSKWHAVGLNERLRFLKYTPGDYFAPHSDGRFVQEQPGPHKGETSYMTVMLYLNEPTKGGETNFLNPRDQFEAVSVWPRAGLALVFDHDLQHEGAMLQRGVKYAIRTDVMFARGDAPPATAAPTGRAAGADADGVAGAEGRAQGRGRSRDRRSSVCTEPPSE